MKAPRKSWLAVTAEVLASRAVLIVGTAALFFIWGIAVNPGFSRPQELTQSASPPIPTESRHTEEIVVPSASPKIAVSRAPVHSFQWPAVRIRCYYPYELGPCK